MNSPPIATPSMARPTDMAQSDFCSPNNGLGPINNSDTPDSTDAVIIISLLKRMCLSASQPQIGAQIVYVPESRKKMTPTTNGDSSNCGYALVHKFCD